MEISNPRVTGRLSRLPSCNLASLSSSKAIFYVTAFIGDLRCIIGAHFLYLNHTISYPITPLIGI
jgi:hypothetical protein